MALTDLNGNLSQRVVIKPQLLQVYHVADTWIELHYVIEAEVKSSQVYQVEHLCMLSIRSCILPQ
jgi:hypothetical protein